LVCEATIFQNGELNQIQSRWDSFRWLLLIVYSVGDLTRWFWTKSAILLGIELNQ
jgi:hypothetical protein